MPSVLVIVPCEKSKVWDKQPHRGPTAASDAYSGHVWSDWMPLTFDMRVIPREGGLYRIRGDNPHTLLYVGQGVIPARPLAHLAKLRDPEHDQSRIFAAHTRFECSWVFSDLWLPHHRLELENDLIAAHLLGTGQIPAAQFAG